MRLIDLSLILVFLICCGNPQKKVATAEAALEPVPVVEDLVYPAEGLFATDFKYINFGQIGYRDRSFREDTLTFPPIKGLVHRAVYAMCPKDTCVAEYAVLALRCPPIEPLLNWVSDTVCTFIDIDCPVGAGRSIYTDKRKDITKKYFSSTEEICDYYIGQLSHLYDDWKCPGEGDHDILNEQAGLLLYDYWHNGNLYTFYRIDWYDALSCGNNSRESFYTVDATTGKQLKLLDLVKPEKFDDLSALMMPRLVNGKGEYIVQLYDYYTLDDKDVLERANGCALIPEGLIIYFYPYNLGCGADGEFEAVIPYEELDGLLKEDISPKDLGNSLHGIDLFGVDMKGSPEHILQELKKDSYIKIDKGQDSLHQLSENTFFCKVYFGSIPFGMNLHYDKDNNSIIKSINFLTSESSDTVIDTIVNSLSDYYGEPDIKDFESYTWFLESKREIRARRLHSEDYGWTISIY